MSASRIWQGFLALAHQPREPRARYHDFRIAREAGGNRGQSELARIYSAENMFGLQRQVPPFPRQARRFFASGMPSSGHGADAVSAQLCNVSLTAENL